MHSYELTGELEGLYRFRIGRLRIFYIIDIEKKTVIITNIDNRGEAY
jgi:mRNA-degrading endonuclease RelE of RelBE toxin-antitoxin system